VFLLLLYPLFLLFKQHPGPCGARSATKKFFLREPAQEGVQKGEPSVVTEKKIRSDFRSYLRSDLEKVIPRWKKVR